MCGIFGIVSKKNINKKKLFKVNKSLIHRGPDDSGLLMFNLFDKSGFPLKFEDSIKEVSLKSISDFNKNLTSAFIHRRLSIVDLSINGHQPMSLNDQSTWIIYNGEIYNYLELKNELISLGYTFKTKTDTEVILASYKEWGSNCVQKFNGMWAFAIADLKRNIIFLSRDRLGIKPLYFYHKNNDFIFASEKKAIINYIDKSFFPNKDVLQKFLFRGELRVGENEDTIFNDIYHLKPGHSLIYNGDSIRKIKYWSLKIKKNNASLSKNVEEFKYLFNDSVRLRLRSDVEVGSCLSGGLDSSSIVATAADKFNKNLNTFSAIWPGEKCDESYFVNLMENHYDIRSNPFIPNLDYFLEDMNKLVWHQEIPLAGPSVLAQWAVMKQIKDNNIKVVLDGQGADEILSGYPYYLETYYYELIKSLKFYELFKNRYYVSNDRSIKSYFKTIKNRNRKKKHSALPIIDGYFENPIKEESMLEYKFSKVSDFTHFDIINSNLPSLLHYEDRNSMAHSIEARVPFLDHRLVEFSISIPTIQKIKGNFQKIILREAMKGRLPEQIYSRRDKIGFETPIESILLSEKGSLHKEIIKYIKTAKLDEFGIDTPKIIDYEKNKWFYFSLLSLSIFKNKFFN